MALQMPTLYDKDRRVGAQVVPRMQRNAALDGYQTTLRNPPNATAMPMIAPRPVQDMGAMGGATPQSPWMRPQVRPSGQGPAGVTPMVGGAAGQGPAGMPSRPGMPGAVSPGQPAGMTGPPQTFTPGAHPGTATSPQGQQGGPQVGGPAFGNATPPSFGGQQPTDRPMTREEYIKLKGTDAYYTDYLNSWNINQNLQNLNQGQGQRQDVLNQLGQGSNIDVVGGPPQSPGRFDQMFNQYQGQGPYGDQVMDYANQFNPNIGITPPSGPMPTSADLPGRSTSYFDQAGGGTPGVSLPGREGIAGTPGREGVDVGIKPSAYGTQATEGALATARQLQEMGRVDPSAIMGLVDPYAKQIRREGGQAAEQALGYLNRAGGGRNIGAVGGTIADITGRGAEQIGQQYSRLMGEAMQRAPGALTSAAGAYGDVANRQGIQAAQQAQLNLGAGAQQVQQRGQDIGVNLQNSANQIMQRGQDIGVLTSNADRLSREMLGMAGLDIQKYLGDRGLDIDSLKNDITAHFMERGENRADAEFQANQFFNALNGAIQVGGQEQQQQQAMADLALKADQGDVQAGLQHTNMLLQQGIANGQLSNEQANMMLNDLYRYWHDPQQFALAYKGLRDNLYTGMRGILANQPSSGFFNSPGFRAFLGAAGTGAAAAAAAG